MLSPKARSRYLPTLTQVVDPSELMLEEGASPQDAAPESTGEDEQKVQQIVQSLMPEVNARLRAAVQEMVEDKLHHLEASMRGEVEGMVRRAMQGCTPSSGL